MRVIQSKKVKKVAFSSFLAPFPLDRCGQGKNQKVLPDPTP